MICEGLYRCIKCSGISKAIIRCEVSKCNPLADLCSLKTVPKLCGHCGGETSCVNSFLSQEKKETKKTLKAHELPRSIPRRIQEEPEEKPEPIDWSKFDKNSCSIWIESSLDVGKPAVYIYIQLHSEKDIDFPSLFYQSITLRMRSNDIKKVPGVSPATWRMRIDLGHFDGTARDFAIKMALYRIYDIIGKEKEREVLRNQQLIKLSEEIEPVVLSVIEDLSPLDIKHGKDLEARFKILE